MAASKAAAAVKRAAGRAAAVRASLERTVERAAEKAAAEEQAVRRRGMAETARAERVAAERAATEQVAEVAAVAAVEGTAQERAVAERVAVELVALTEANIMRIPSGAPPADPGSRGIPAQGFRTSPRPPSEGSRYSHSLWSTRTGRSRSALQRSIELHAGLAGPRLASIAVGRSGILAGDAAADPGASAAPSELGELDEPQLGWNASGSTLGSGLGSGGDLEPLGLSIAAMQSASEGAGLEPD